MWTVKGWMSAASTTSRLQGPDEVPAFEARAQYVPDIQQQVRAAAGLGCKVIAIIKDDEEETTR